ncbi:hypothetical protein TNCT_492311 [Trichonephila clavata]|uniref:Uncharacterized protein n=1 Tax=Trichonephila clavata TaxID=2740835 RepID=A0A8X6KXS0_TRICU|nr:hypothetical protein TNCT_492311 [Trichonephila clavata]
MLGVVGIPYYFLESLDWGRKLRHPVSKPLVVAVRLVGFSDTWSAAEEKRTHDDERMLDAEESIHCIVNNPQDVEIDHFFNSIFRSVVYGQVGSDGEGFFSLDTLDV